MEQIIMEWALLIGPAITAISTIIIGGIAIYKQVKKILNKLSDDTTDKIDNHDRQILIELREVKDELTKIRGRKPKE